MEKIIQASFKKESHNGVIEGDNSPCCSILQVVAKPFLETGQYAEQWYYRAAAIVVLSFAAYRKQIGLNTWS